MSTSQMTARLGSGVLLLLAAANGQPSEGATGRFEVYCDSVGLFLAKVEGAPAPRKLLLFLYMGFPGVSYVPKDEWKEVKVYRNGCAADAKCDVLAHGRIRITRLRLTDDMSRGNTKSISRANRSTASLRLNGTAISTLHAFASNSGIPQPNLPFSEKGHRSGSHWARQISRRSSIR